MFREIERKFLVKNPPENINDFEFVNIIQGYFEIVNEDYEVRLRMKGNQYFQTVKKGNGLNRQEFEIELTEEQFDSLWPLTERRRIIKRRCRIPYLEHMVEFDIYEDRFNGLITAEVEFESELAAREFIPPKWFDDELTEDHELQNNNLALSGIPEYLLQKYDIIINEENVYQQSGVVPIRQTTEPEVLIITNRTGKQWIFPKGIIGKGLSRKESAATEAYEEAGVQGEVGDKIGFYEYRKNAGICHVEMFLMENVMELNHWPESFRIRKWIPVKKLPTFMKKESLQPIVKILLEKYS